MLVARARSPRLGQVVRPPTGASVLLVEQRVVNMEVLGILGSSIVSAVSLVLFARGRDKAGYALGVTAALLGGIVGAARVIGERP